VYFNKVQYIAFVEYTKVILFGNFFRRLPSDFIDKIKSGSTAASSIVLLIVLKRSNV
jgi:hypothetical protein